MAASASCLLVVMAALASAASAQLSSTFYDTSCPNALSTIKSGVDAAVMQEAPRRAFVDRSTGEKGLDRFIPERDNRPPSSYI
ncbi:unnamed protein product [Miscanthus lutarioriparius]|uniref:Peroxidase n=1 Tax=Miscanthus lutarioriparius TaxID=422564 RepID=A0A811N1A4_9POAL|nr:unnamed protein product [Miscanthus lutarioriparius]